MSRATLKYYTSASDVTLDLSPCHLLTADLSPRTRCEMRFTVDLVLGDFDQEESADVLREFGTILHKSLRRSDIIMQRDNSFYLLLPDLSEQNKLAVISRIRKNLQKEGLYQVLLMRVDAMMIGPDREYETWYQVAV